MLIDRKRIDFRELFVSQLVLRFLVEDQIALALEYRYYLSKTTDFLNTMTLFAAGIL